MSIKAVGYLIGALLFSLCAVNSTFAQAKAKQTSSNNDLEEEAKIQAVYQGWRDAVESSQIEGYVKVLHADVRMLPPMAPAIHGKDSYAQFLVPVFDAATYDIEVNQLQLVDVVGDIATAEYVYTITLNRKNPDVGVSEPGALTGDVTTARYFDVLRKSAEGEWKVWRHSWQAYAQPTAPEL